MTTQDRVEGVEERRFADEVLAAVRASGVDEAWYDADRFAIGYRRDGEEGEGSLFLDNIYRECRDGDDEYRRSRIDRLVQGAVHSPGLPDDWAQAAPLLRPVLRPATFGIDATPSSGKRPVSRPALPYLREFVVVDTPTTMAYVIADQVAVWGVPAEEVFATARANLARHASPGDTPPADGPAIYRFVDDGDAYFVSRILLDGWLAGLAGSVGGRPVAFVPDTSTLIVAADEPGTVVALLEMVEKQYMEAPRGVSPQAYTVDDAGRAVPYPVVDGHPAAAAASRAAAVLASCEYGAQKDRLTDEYEINLIEMFVATLMVRQGEDGSIRTFASWAEGVKTALPRADVIMFGPPDGPPFAVAWADAAALVDLTPVPDLDPPRFHVDYWPEPAVVEQLRARAISL